jgi:hypothetical protein
MTSGLIEDHVDANAGPVDHHDKPPGSTTRVVPPERTGRRDAACCTGWHSGIVGEDEAIAALEQACSAIIAQVVETHAKSTAAAETAEKRAADVNSEADAAVQRARLEAQIEIVGLQDVVDGLRSELQAQRERLQGAPLDERNGDTPTCSDAELQPSDSVSLFRSQLLTAREELDVSLAECSGLARQREVEKASRARLMAGVRAIQADLLNQIGANRRQLDDLETAHTADRAQLEQALAAEQQLALSARRREAQAALDLRAELGAGLAERLRLHIAIDEQQESHDRVEAELATARAQFETAHAKDQVERQRLTDLLHQRDAERRQLEALEAAHASDRVQLEQALAAEQQLAVRERQREAQGALDLRAELGAAVAERLRLHTAIDEQQESHDRVEAELAAARAEFETAHAEDQVERQRLSDLLHQRDAERRQLEALEAAHASDRAQLEQALAAEQQLAVSARRREAQAALDLRAELDAALAERLRLRSAIDEQRESRDRVEVEFAAARAQFEAAHAKDQVERQRLTDLLHQRDAERRQLEALEAAHASDRAELEQALAAAHQLAVRERQREAQAALDLRAELDAALAERLRLHSAIDEQGESRDRVEVEFAAARAQFEAAHVEDQVERQRLTDLLHQRDAERRQLEALEAAHASDRAQLQQALAAAQQLAVRERQREAQAALDLRAELDAAVAERQRLHTAIDEQQESHDRVEAELAAARAQFDTAHEEDQVERQYLTDLLHQRDAERRQLEALEAAHASDRAQLQQALAAAQQLTASERQREAQAARDLRAELDAAVAERLRLHTAIDEQQESHDRVEAELAAARSQFETAYAEDQVERQRLTDLLHQRGAERRQLEALDVAHAADRGQLEQALAAEQQFAVSERRREAEAALDLRAELDAAMANTCSDDGMGLSMRSRLSVLRLHTVPADDTSAVAPAGEAVNPVETPLPESLTAAAASEAQNAPVRLHFEPPEYARQLLDDIEAVYAADVASGLVADDLVDRLASNLTYGAEVFARRLEIASVPETSLFEQQLINVLNTNAETSFGRRLAVAAHKCERQRKQLDHGRVA